MANSPPKTLNAKRFAALLAGFDIGNMSEEEALSKARALRRMAADAGLRVVDALELPEVRKAIDDQMQPNRHDSSDAQEVLEFADGLREELLERTRDVTRLAEALARQEEMTERLQRELSGAKGQAVWRASSDAERKTVRRPPPKAKGPSTLLGASFFEWVLLVIAGLLPYLGIIVGQELFRKYGH